METLIGFAIGFMVGTRQGKEGVSRMRETLLAIRESPDVRQVVGDAVVAFSPVVRELARATGGAS
jgi:hypothetical protein